MRQSIELRPDVVLMDLNLPDLPGLEATRRIAAAAPEVAVLVLTMVDDDDSVLATLRVGARGYILKGADQDEVLAAIRAVAAGGAVFGRSIAERVLQGGRGPGRDLTTREAEVLSGIARGLSNPQIANELGVSVKTVQNHASRVLASFRSLTGPRPPFACGACTRATSPDPSTTTRRTPNFRVVRQGGIRGARPCVLGETGAQRGCHRATCEAGSMSSRTAEIMSAPPARATMSPFEPVGQVAVGAPGSAQDERSGYHRDHDEGHHDDAPASSEIVRRRPKGPRSR